MSKPIKVEDQVYDELDRLRDKRETFSDVVENLLKLRAKTCELVELLEDDLKFQEHKQRTLQDLVAAREED